MIPCIPKVFAIFISTLLITTIQSQNLDTVYREYISGSELFVNYSRFIQKASDTSLLLITNNGKNSILDFKGRIIKDASLKGYPQYWDIPMGYFEGYASDSVPVYYLKTIEDECDSWGGNRLHKVSQSGEYLEYMTFHLPAPWNYAYFPSSYMVFPQKEWLPKLFLIKEGKSILYFNADSLLFLNNLSSYRSHCINNTGDICLVGSDSICYYRYGVAGPELETKKMGDQFIHTVSQAIFLNDSTIAMLSRNAITVWDQQLNLTQSISPFEGKQISMSKWQDPFLWVYIGDENIPANFKVYDENLNLIFQNKLNIYEKGFLDFYWLADSTLITVGSEGYGAYPASLYSYVKSYLFSVHGKNNHQDVSLSGIEYDDVIASGSGICIGDSTIKFIAQNVKVKISNLGNSQIDQLIVIPDHQFCSYYCWHTPLYRTEFHGLNIEPGEISELFIGDVQIELDANENLNELCLSVILPDNHTDIDKENNRFCVEKITQSIIPSADDLISFFPNPAFDKIYFENLSKENFTAVVFDVQGRFILSELITLENTGVNIDGIRPGMYFIQITSANDIMKIDKFIKL